MNWMDPVTVFRSSKSTICEEMRFWPDAAFSSSACGITNSNAGQIVKISRRIFGRFCRNAALILRTLLCPDTGVNRTNKSRKGPHPNPLPSDGRGDVGHTFRENSSVGLFDRFVLVWRVG